MSETNEMAGGVRSRPHDSEGGEGQMLSPSPPTPGSACGES